MNESSSIVKSEIEDEEEEIDDDEDECIKTEVTNKVQ